MQPQLISLLREFAISAWLQTTCRAGCHCRTLPLPKSCSCRHIADVRQFPGIAESFQLWNSSALFYFSLLFTIQLLIISQSIQVWWVCQAKDNLPQLDLAPFGGFSMKFPVAKWCAKEAGMGCIMLHVILVKSFWLNIVQNPFFFFQSLGFNPDRNEDLAQLTVSLHRAFRVSHQEVFPTQNSPAGDSRSHS